MAEKKMTKAQKYEVIKNIVLASGAENRVEMVDFIDHEIELLNKKSGKNRMTKTQKINLEIADALKNIMVGIARPVQVKELLASDEVKNLSEDYGMLSGQKVTAILSGMVKRGEVIRTEEKKVAYFSIN